MMQAGRQFLAQWLARPPGERLDYKMFVEFRMLGGRNAYVLYISVNTANTHRQRIIRKLDASKTTEAIRYALDLGILSEGA